MRFENAEIKEEDTETVHRTIGFGADREKMD